MIAKTKSTDSARQGVKKMTNHHHDEDGLDIDEDQSEQYERGDEEVPEQSVQK